ncbi:uncharacterized protein LOC142646195 isoform X2 [Dermatophagoides pteronyssinus]|uniref:uncharacterized protein LOC142646195 isoform X2 n=1 Tax=Dermatophagoides pteronyssinus TaxID=6956 RepID=UPI003F66A3A1
MTSTTIQSGKISKGFQISKWLQSGCQKIKIARQRQIDFFDDYDDDDNDAEKISDYSDEFCNEFDFHHPYTMIIISNGYVPSSSNALLKTASTKHLSTRFKTIYKKLFFKKENEQNLSTRENLWSFKAFFLQNVSHFRQMIANFGTKIVQFFLIINEKIKEMVNNCNLRSSSSIVYPVTINIRSESNDGIQSNGNGNVVRNEREKVSIIEIDSIPTL